VQCAIAYCRPAGSTLNQLRELVDFC